MTILSRFYVYKFYKSSALSCSADLIDKSKTFNYLLEKIDEDEKEVIKEINQFIILQKV